MLFKRIINKKIDSIEDINNILCEGIRGNNFARAGIENAYWDLICRKNNTTLRKLIEYKLEQLGVEGEDLRSKGYVESGVSIGIPMDKDLETLGKWAGEYIGSGYRRVKIKIKPGWDVKAVEAVRKVIGNDFPLWTDSNASFDFELHKDIFKKMDQYGCLFHEQPLNYDDLIDHAKLSRYINTPVCLDESLKSLRTAKQAIEIGASRIWNIKIQRIGGLYEGLLIYKLASENDVSLWGGTMPESGLGAIFILNLASFSRFKYPADVEASERWYGPGNDIVEIKMDKDGYISVPDCRGVESIINFSNLSRFGKLLRYIKR